MTPDEKKRIEDHINTYRVYPPEYTGRPDKKLLREMDESYRFNPKDNTITRKEGRINSNGDFEIIGLFKFPIDNPEAKTPATTIDRDLKFITTVYNDIMEDLGYKDSIISQDRDTKDWTLRDMVAEVDYIRSTYVYGGPKSVMKKTDNKRYTRELYRLYGFLRQYKNRIDGIPAHATHNSKYDN